MTDSTQQEIQINVKGPSELKLQITITNDKTVLDLKRSIADKSDVEADRQRLIYSGRVLKDDDVLSTYKIQSSHTIHMVKGVARTNVSASSNSNPNSNSNSTSTPTLPTMQSGQNPNDPLTQLNSHLGYGALAGFNPFPELGLNPNDPNLMQTMMQSPQFMQQMSSVMGNPAILDQIIASNPQLASMGPQVREVFQSERFREMISNPESLRSMLQMASAFQGAGGGAAGASPFGGTFGSGGFPAPGNPSTAPAPSSPSPPITTGAGAPNPFAALFPPVSSSAGTGTGAGGAMFDPATLAQMQAALGGAGGLSGFGGLGGFNPGAGVGAGAPTDSRPPEERFQVQLQQLQDMGFTNASQNVRALLATGGNVHSAIEYILGGGGL